MNYTYSGVVSGVEWMNIYDLDAIYSFCLNLIIFLLHASHFIV